MIQWRLGFEVCCRSLSVLRFVCRCLHHLLMISGVSWIWRSSRRIENLAFEQATAVVPKCPIKGEGCSTCCRTVPYSNWTTCSFWNLISQSSCRQISLIPSNFFKSPGWRRSGTRFPCSRRCGTNTAGLRTALSASSTTALRMCAFSGNMSLGLLGFGVGAGTSMNDSQWQSFFFWISQVMMTLTSTSDNETSDEVKEDSKRNWKTRNLCFAKHRHSSILKPASRFVLHTSAIIHAAMETLVIASVTISINSIIDLL